MTLKGIEVDSTIVNSQNSNNQEPKKLELETNQESQNDGGDISPVSEISMGSSHDSGAGLGVLLLNMGQQPQACTVEEFKSLMYKMQAIRRRIVDSILTGKVSLETEWVDLLKRTYEILTDSNTNAFQRAMLSKSAEKFLLNVKDEIKDLLFLEHLNKFKHKTTRKNDLLKDFLWDLDFVEILEPFHPISKETFREEYNSCISFLRDFIRSDVSGRKPVMITDWDGTMKDYCSQYATNLQPIYSAISMAQFAETFTRLTAVLTAGPLRGPGILDLTALPIDGPVMFSGSWGREWWLGGKRVVHDDGISEEGIVALERLNEEMKTLLDSKEYAQFGMVGSGMQRKVDRLTLGIQTVCKHVQPELSSRYQSQVLERVHRTLHFDPSTDLEVEVVVKNNDVVWNKSHGVDRVVKTVGDSLSLPGRILICGDTSSDLPMVQYSLTANPTGVMALFVGANDSLKERVRDIIPDDSRVAFVSCPDVIHAAMMHLLREKYSNSIESANNSFSNEQNGQNNTLDEKNRVETLNTNENISASQT